MARRPRRQRILSNPIPSGGFKPQAFRFDYPDIGSFLQAAHSPNPNATYRDQASRVISHESFSFEGVHSWQEMVNLYLKGWPEGLSRLVSAMAHATHSTDNVPDYDLSVAGAHPIPAIAATGIPSCMVIYDEDNSKRQKPVIRLALQLWASCAYTTNELMTYGAALLSYVDALEQANYRCELNVMYHCRDNGSAPKHYSTHTALIRVKNAEQPIELDRMAFCLVHSSLFRKAGIAHIYGQCIGHWQNAGTADDNLPDLGPDMLIVPGINVLMPRSPFLQDPAMCLSFLEPLLSEQLAQKGLPPVKLAFSRDTTLDE